MAGLGGDPVQRQAGEGGGSGVSGSQGVGGDPGAIEAGGDGAVSEHPGDDVVAERLVADPAGPDAGEQGTGLVAADLEPSSEGGDGVGGGVGAVGDGDDLAVSFLVGLGAADGEQQPGWFGVDAARVRATSSEPRMAEA
jgi:hypothetical protein